MPGKLTKLKILHKYRFKDNHIFSRMLAYTLRMAQAKNRFTVTWIGLFTL